MRFKEFFYKEFILENAAHSSSLLWVYHRTKIDPYEHPLSKGEFIIDNNIRASYGRGLYTTYDLESQLDDRMESLYGKSILKFKINISNFVILDQRLFNRIFPQKNYYDFLKDLNINIVYKRPKHLEEDDEDNTYLYTSDTALKYAKQLKNKGFDGVIFVGRQDGKVAVIWRPDTLVLHSFSNDGGKNWNLIGFKKIKTSELLHENLWNFYKKNNTIPFWFQEKTLDEKVEILKKTIFYVIDKYDDIYASSGFSLLKKFVNDEKIRSLFYRILTDYARSKDIHNKMPHILLVLYKPEDYYDFIDLILMFYNNDLYRINYRFLDEFKNYLNSVDLSNTEIEDLKDILKIKDGKYRLLQDIINKKLTN